ncbi:MAG: hypothetical protein U0556_00345 [Dehalococcoidia bacterium]
MVSAPRLATPPLAGLRGALLIASPGARGIERLARNPSCLRLAAIVASGTSPSMVAKAVYRDASQDSQSPFAFASGNGFERGLLQDDAARLREAFPNLPTNARVVDASKSDNKAAFTRQLLLQRLNDRPDAPQLILKPSLVVEVGATPYRIEPDFLITEDGPYFRVGEIKSYLDRGGKTAPSKIGGASRQAAVEVVGLRRAYAAIGVSDVDRATPPVSELILRRPGTRLASRRTMQVAGEVSSIERMLAGLPETFERIRRETIGWPTRASLADRAHLERLPANFRPECREHCPLASSCRAEAESVDSLAILGSAALTQIPGVDSFTRARALIDGAPAVSPEEAAVQQRLRRAWQAQEEAIGANRP